MTGAASDALIGCARVTRGGSGALLDGLVDIAVTTGDCVAAIGLDASGQLWNLVTGALVPARLVWRAGLAI